MEERQQHHLTAAAVDQALAAYEHACGISSREFYSSYYSDDPRVSHIPLRHCSRWASLLRTRDRLRDAEDTTLADQVGRELEHA